MHELRRIAPLVAMPMAFATRLMGQTPIRHLTEATAAETQSAVFARRQDSAVVWKAWVGLTVGSSFNGSVTETPGQLEKTGGELTLWVTRNHLAMGVRAAGSGSILDESGGPHTGDVSALVGYHLAPVRRIDGVVAIGIGSNSLSEFLTHYPDQPVVVASAQLIANLYVIGVGVDAFAAAGAHRRYAGIGTAFCLGWLR